MTKANGTAAKGKNAKKEGNGKAIEAISNTHECQRVNTPSKKRKNELQIRFNHTFIIVFKFEPSMKYFTNSSNTGGVSSTTEYYHSMNISNKY